MKWRFELGHKTMVSVPLFLPGDDCLLSDLSVSYITTGQSPK